MSNTAPGTVGPGYNAGVSGGGPSSAGPARLPVHSAPPWAQVGALAIPAGQSVYMRCLGAGTITQIGIYVTAGSGSNGAVAVYSSNQPPSGAGPPRTQIAYSGVVPIPTAAAVINLGGPVTVDQNCFLAIGVDASVTVLSTLSSGAFSTSSGWGTGMAYACTSIGSALPAVIDSTVVLSTIRGNMPIMFGS